MIEDRLTFRMEIPPIIPRRERVIRLAEPYSATCEVEMDTAEQEPEDSN